MASIAVRPASVVHVLSSAHRDAVRHPKLVIIHNDVDVPDVVAPAEARQPEVLFAGEISRRKGLDVLLDAWTAANLDDWRLVLCGPAGDFDISVARELPDVTWRGEVSHDEVLRRMQDASIVVLPSREEAFPMALCEAMAAGCAVLATDVGGAKDLLGPDSPFLVAPGDPAALAEGLKQLACDSSLLAEVAAANRRRARDRVSTETVSNEWRDLYAAVDRGDDGALARRPR
jgi:glycosyltransferase involved in cell wall biosynthesis